MFEILLAVCVGTALAIICVIVGGWLMFKGKAGPGEGFVRTPKGQVFSIPDAEQAEDFPAESETAVAERSKKFLDGLLGGGQ
ncbi:MAG: hypothetical protein M0R00_06875 [Candidatus Omnitrophica bacterium]|jgi:hypothetical protein|nr:hypothetical protein [Candidatus Omnitrophota bacterium]